MIIFINQSNQFYKFNNMQIVPNNYYNNINKNVNNIESITIKFNNLNMDKS